MHFRILTHLSLPANTNPIPKFRVCIDISKPSFYLTGQLDQTHPDSLDSVHVRTESFSLPVNFRQCVRNQTRAQTNQLD